jgi:hypothetical protein
MKLNQHDVIILSSMIRGDQSHNRIFPYRKIEKLSVFFQNLGLNYTYDSSIQRIQWVESVIKDLNERADPDSSELSDELKMVIRGTLDPDDYLHWKYTDLKKAKKLMNEMLNEYQLNLDEILHPEKEIARIPTKTEVQKSEARSIIITPQVFVIPSKKIQNNLVSVMMPLSKDFQDVFDAIKQSCNDAQMDCQRANDIWKNSVIIQDIFELIYTSGIVIADFSKRNPNVFYEVGIAHTLGRHVIPIAQSMDDVPFDLHHHRVQLYLDNVQGRLDLQKALYSRIMTIKQEFLSD